MKNMNYRGFFRLSWKHCTIADAEGIRTDMYLAWSELLV